MKILYHHRVGSKDGQAVHIEEIVTALREAGHEVFVVGPASSEKAEFGADSGMIATLKKRLPASFYELLELGYSVLAFLRLWRVYRRERPDVLYERYNLYLLAGVWLKRLTRMPMLLEINAPLVHERSKFGGLANRRLAAWVEGVTWRSADIVLPVTNVLAGFVRAAGVPAERMTVIQNGVGKEFLSGHAESAKIRQRYGLEDGIVLGFTGFVREWHGLERVIELIAASDPQLKLQFLIVGDGPAVPELRRLAASLGLDRRVVFAGLVPRHEIVDLIEAFDVALQPQVVAYASPLKLFEYMALGRPIVAPSTANIREVLGEGEAVLFDPADSTGFRRAIEQLCHDPALRDRLGKAAREAVNRQGLTWANNARRIVGLFEGLLQDRGSLARIDLNRDARLHRSEP
jgi:glycosyltransferase involved in cell wall biosynthesis